LTSIMTSRKMYLSIIPRSNPDFSQGVRLGPDEGPLADPSGEGLSSRGSSVRRHRPGLLRQTREHSLRGDRPRPLGGRIGVRLGPPQEGEIASDDEGPDGRSGAVLLAPDRRRSAGAVRRGPGARQARVGAGDLADSSLSGGRLHLALPGPDARHRPLAHGRGAAQFPPGFASHSGQGGEDPQRPPGGVPAAGPLPGPPRRLG